MKGRPDTDPMEVSLVHRPKPSQWLKVITTYDEGCRVLRDGVNRWYRWTEIRKHR